jgi:hypothetical protein
MSHPQGDRINDKLPNGVTPALLRDSQYGSSQHPPESALHHDPLRGSQYISHHVP